MSHQTLLDGWVEIQLYRRFAKQSGFPQTYTMGVARRNEIDFIAYFAHVENGECIGLPDFTKGEVDARPMRMTQGVLDTYGYTPGRAVLYNRITQELKEK